MLLGAYADTTRANVQTAMRSYWRWAEQNGVNVGGYDEIAITNYVAALAATTNRYGRPFSANSLRGYISNIRTYYTSMGFRIGDVSDSPVLRLMLRALRQAEAAPARHVPASARPLLREMGLWHDRLRLPPRGVWSQWAQGHHLSGADLFRLRDMCMVLVAFMFGIRQHSVAAFRKGDVADLFTNRSTWRIRQEKGAERAHGIRANPVWYDCTSGYALDLLRAFTLRADAREDEDSFWAIPSSRDPNGRVVAAAYGRLLERQGDTRRAMETFHSIRAWFESFGAALHIDTNTRSWVAGWAEGSGSQRQRYYNHVRIEDDCPYFLLGYLLTDAQRVQWAFEMPPHERWHRVTHLRSIE